MRLQNKVAIITGGSRGIGFATADKFLKEGATVILTASTQESADKAVARLKEKYADQIDVFCGLEYDICCPERPEGYDYVIGSLHGLRIDGVDYYNSSIDSSPTRSAAALSAMKDKSLVLICGGYDKNLPYEPLARAICDHGGVRGVSLTGATGEKIRAEIEKYQAKNGVGENIKVEYNRDFKTAVSTARTMAVEGDCVLLTPASASFDAFKNFMERGNTFKKLIEEF